MCRRYVCTTDTEPHVQSIKYRNAAYITGPGRGAGVTRGAGSTFHCLVRIETPIVANDNFYIAKRR